jgi:archaeal flagellar protein FlaI
MVGKKLEIKGLLYRKLFKSEEKKEIKPKFYIKRVEKIELKKVSDITKIDVSYQLIENFVSVRIKWDPEKKEVVYNVIEPTLSEEDKKILESLSEFLISVIDIDLSSIKDTERVISYLENKIWEFIKDYNIDIKPENYLKIFYYIYRNFVGLNEIEPLMQDPYIEDISCDGVGIPIYIIHRKYGTMRTNIVYNDIETLRDFIVKLSERCGRYVSYAEPILDATLPDGSRVAATIASDVATRGATFTIRKFSERPFSPIEQVELNTVSTEMLAYLWYLIQHKSSGIIVGGTATGKTSFLNSLAMFIPPEAKIVSIEDTRELRLAHQHWIAGLARVGFGVPTPTGEKYGEVTLFDLLRETFRQNPDYVIVGETRGEETYVMFQGMASGHASLSTFHAGSLETFVKRITTPPINLSPTLIESLNFIIVMTHAKEKGAAARRVKEIIEIISVDPRTNEIATNVVFRWNPAEDKYEKVNDSVLVRRIAGSIGASYEEALREIERRKRVLDWLVNRGIKDYMEVNKIINEYYKEPLRIMEMIGETIPVKQAEIIKPSEEMKGRPKRVSILELLGFKFLKEKENV